ncbi:lysine-specific demethylase 2A-like [Centruroides sculpturatus]|uniref:lysine-specific demethylase 2A-like n=1 Tax=Centruroides sculpturatus TaxID=218467 RepID=UPI000C6EA1A6|nr:lysine-specific demethylase 2A-like [Centruroides sculpturatus]
MKQLQIKLTSMDDQQETGRKLRVKERKHYTDDCLQDEDIEGKRLFSVEEKLNSEQFGNYFVKELKGEEFSLKYFQEYGFEYPILFKDKSGLGMRMPSNNFTVNDVRQCVGSRRILDVMDVTTQKDTEMTMKEWCQYFEDPKRERLLNVISLEFSHTRLEHYVESPTVVRQVDWVDLVWPRHLKESQIKGTNDIEDMKYPKVQKTNLGFAPCERGVKVFWLIPPTEHNIQLYEQWVLSGKQGDVFFGDTVEKCARIHLYDGYTFFIPTGWIHAVFTPEDSLVFGGNFLHSFGIKKQLRIAQVEDITHVPPKFRYPFYTEILWYVLQRYVNCVKGKNHLTCNEEGDPVKLDAVQPNGTISEENKQSNSENTRKQSVHLTRLEIEGLHAIKVWLQSLPQNKKSIPDLIYNYEALIADVESLIREHINDDCRLAITGKPVLFWIESKKPRKQRNSHPYLSKPTKALSNKAGGPRHRRTRCKKCEACRRNDCGECTFCKDMRKYGGPGRMKQSCISRQCMAPMLPHPACCILCGQNGYDKNDDSEEQTCNLMECSECWEIVHPSCLQEKMPDLPEGIINDDLPNSWECPKCCGHGKPEDIKPRQIKPLRQKLQICNEAKDSAISASPPVPKSVATSTSSPALSPLSVPLSLSSLLSSPNQVYGIAATEIKSDNEPPTKKPKLDNSNIQEIRNNVSPVAIPELTIDNMFSEKTKESIEDVLEEKTIKTFNTPLFSSVMETTMPSPNKDMNKEKTNIQTAIGRTPDIVMRQHRSEISYPPRVTTRKHKESTRERLVRSMKGLRKSSELHISRTKSSIDRSNKPSVSNTTVLSKCTVKVEKVDVQRLMKKTEQGGLIDTANKEVGKETPIATVSQTPQTSESPAFCDERINLQSQKFSTMLRDRSNLQKSKCLDCVSCLSTKCETEHMRTEQENLALEKEVIFPVFRYLTHTDLFICQLVCKTWSRWAIDPKLWTRMNVSRRRVTINGLLGITRRQPLSLNLSWTNITFKQLSWLIARLPQLKELLLSGCSSTVITALCSCNCPLLRYLDLRWIDGLTDSMIRDLVSPPKDSRPGFVETRTRLRHLAEIRLSGTDISDVSVRLLAHHLPLLSRLDLSHCHQITDMGIAVLGAAKASRLSSLDVSSCSNITDTSLEALRRCTSLTFLDLRDCGQVSELACSKFVRQNNFMLTVRDGKLLQKQT